MSSLAPDSFASSIAWRTAYPAVSEPSVPTTMRPNIQSSLVWNRAHTTPLSARRLPPAMGTVETVGGPIDLDDLGTTLVHEHLGARDEAVHAQWPHAMTIAEEEPLHEVGPDGAHEIAARLAHRLRELGVRTICDPSAMFLGRSSSCAGYRPRPGFRWCHARGSIHTTICRSTSSPAIPTRSPSCSCTTSSGGSRARRSRRRSSSAPPMSPG